MYVERDSSPSVPITCGFGLFSMSGISWNPHGALLFYLCPCWIVPSLLLCLQTPVFCPLLNPVCCRDFLQSFLFDSLLLVLFLAIKNGFSWTFLCVSFCCCLCLWTYFTRFYSLFVCVCSCSCVWVLMEACSKSSGQACFSFCPAPTQLALHAK